VEETLRNRLGERFGMRHVHLADTGRAALAIALLALSRMRPKRNEVLIPAYVSFSVPSAVVNAGFKIRLYDVNPEDLTPDYASMRKTASERTLAVIVCHQFGLPFDPAPAAALCRNCGAALIDDAAQAMGGKVKGIFAGCLGDVGMFSLSRGKPLTAVDGGILLTNNDGIAQKIAEVSANLSGSASDATQIIKAAALLFLRRPIFYTLPASLPQLNIGASVFDPSFQSAPISPFRAGLALAALRSLDSANASRAHTAERYLREFANIPFVRPIPPQPESASVYLRFPMLPKPDGVERIQTLMREKGGHLVKRLGVSPGFPLPLNAIPALRPHLAKAECPLPGARLLAENLITLPTHDQVREKDIVAITRLLSKASEKSMHDAEEERP
jgi:dTDP-4-amino-4,6-dideoxygalactose transaminase